MSGQVMPRPAQPLLEPRSPHSCFPNLASASSSSLNRSSSSSSVMQLPSTSGSGSGGMMHAPTGVQSRLARASQAHAMAQQNQQLLQPVWERYADDESNLQVEQLENFLTELNVDCSGTDVLALVDTITAGSPVLDWTQTLALYSILISGQMPGPPGSPDVPPSRGSLSAHAPLRKVLAKNRYYMETGMLAYDESVVAYISKLDEHRKKCEEDGRYGEARAAVKRLADLKTAQVERLRVQLTSHQQYELEEVHKVYGDDTDGFQSLWDSRCSEYEYTFGMALEDLKMQHQQQVFVYADELQARRPMRHKPSKAYLEQRKKQDRLVQTKDYRRAERVKAATDELYDAELEESSVSYDLEIKLKVAKFQAKHSQEMEGLLQRGARGRDELELRRVRETERRTYRFRNIVAELESLHRLELVHLENFLEGQVQAGKAVPLKDGFKRKREILLNTQF